MDIVPCLHIVLDLSIIHSVVFVSLAYCKSWPKAKPAVKLFIVLTC